jgi:trehalose 6-phosphate phosphatase
MRNPSPATATARLPRRFWERVCAADHRLLLLDYDGTLAPFRLAREEARPYPSVIPLLHAAGRDRRTTLAVISGRPLGELARFLSRLPALLAGEHGWDVRGRNRRITRHPLPRGVPAALKRAAAAAAVAGWGSLLERKRAALVLHTRGLPRRRAEDIAAACAGIWKREAGGPGLRLDPIDGGLELRASARNKGTVVRELMERSPRGTLAVFLGDDQNDEDAFREVLVRGFGVRVGPGKRPSLARGRIPSGRGVADFLRQWISVLTLEASQEVQHV